MSGLTDDERALLHSALYDTETASGWYGEPECAEVARLMAPAVERIVARRVSVDRAKVEAALALADEWEAVDAWVGWDDVSDSGGSYISTNEHAATELRAVLGAPSTTGRGGKITHG